MSDGADAVGPRHCLRELAVDLGHELARIHAREFVASAMELSPSVVVLTEASKGAGERDTGLAEVGKQTLFA